MPHERRFPFWQKYPNLLFDIERGRRSPISTGWRDNPVETFAMFRTPIIAALTAALLGGTAMAQPADAPPANLSGSARSAPDYDDDDAPPPPAAGAYDNSQKNPAAAQLAQADRYIFCRRDAAARTGYT